MVPDEIGSIVYLRRSDLRTWRLWATSAWTAPRVSLTMSNAPCQAIADELGQLTASGLRSAGRTGGEEN
jgi:hypothetical protein